MRKITALDEIITKLSEYLPFMKLDPYSFGLSSGKWESVDK